MARHVAELREIEPGSAITVAGSVWAQTWAERLQAAVSSGDTVLRAAMQAALARQIAIVDEVAKSDYPMQTFTRAADVHLTKGRPS